MLLAVMLMSVMMPTLVSAKTNNANNSNQVKKVVPKSIVVRQIINFDDGRMLVLYWKKEGASCELYSDQDLKQYNLNDTNHVMTSELSRVDHVEGKLVRKATFAEACRIFKALVNQYL